MNEKLIKEIVYSELTTPTFGVTEQYLEIHEVVKENGQIKIERVDLERNDNIAIAYIPIVGESFHLAVYINIKKGEIAGVTTESYNRVYFNVTSEHLTFEELQEITCLNPTEYWNKGDLRKNGKSRYNFSSFKLLPNPEPDEFEDKLRKLLDILETDKNGIIKLVQKANAGITVAMNFHNGNGMLGGMSIDKENIARMSKLNLAIEFDVYADGNYFK